MKQLLFEYSHQYDPIAPVLTVHIGRDVLNQFVLTLDGLAGYTTIDTHPS